MDAIRVAKVSGVQYSKSGQASQGTVHLTAHHLIFKHDQLAIEELWVPYPLISLVTRLPQTLLGLTPLSFRTRTFESFSLCFPKESDAIDVFDSIRELTVAMSVTQLYAFFFNSPQLDLVNPKDGWKLYVPHEEFARMGLGTRTKAWRYTDINKDYSFCPTYPSCLVVPAKISDATLAYASKYRSKARIPVLTYIHWANHGSITRSSQPMVGLTNSRSIQDEKLIEAIFQSHWFSETGSDHRARSRMGVQVYGATATNLIIDARPTANAMVNVGKGGGTENMDNYREGKKVYLGVDNIHAMRDSLSKVVDALREADSLSEHLDSATSPPLLDRQALRRSGWLRHLSAILDGTLLIVRNVHVNSSHVLIHCSDGWDRTAQLSSLAQLSLDPFYRTIRGFQILIEKDWLSFGHRFTDRCGHLSSERFFQTSSLMDGNDAPQAQAQAFLVSMQNKFTGLSHLRETSPVFHQFLECVRQLQRQFPARFEFNERFLERLHYHLYSCQFGTFLFNSERERQIPGDDGSPPGAEKTRSVWEWFNSETQKSIWVNNQFNQSLDDPKRGDMGVLIFDPKDVRFWHELYGRTDDEMNGRTVVSQTIGIDAAVVDGGMDDTLAARTDFPSSSAQGRLITSENPIKSAPPIASSPSPTPPILADSSKPVVLTTSNSSLRPSVRTRSPLASPRHAPISLSHESASGPSFVGGFGAGAFGSGGMKSMWGKLSLNATAALSAVSDAAKDFSQGISATGMGTSTSKEMLEGVNRPAEMENRQRTLSQGDSGQAAAWPSTGNLEGLQNPWPTLMPFSDQNPQPPRVKSSVSYTGQHYPYQSATLSQDSSLSGSLLLRAEFHSSSQVVGTTKDLPPTPHENTAPKDIDPLGVGFS